MAPRLWLDRAAWLGRVWLDPAWLDPAWPDPERYSYSRPHALGSKLSLQLSLTVDADHFSATMRRSPVCRVETGIKISRRCLWQPPRSTCPRKIAADPICTSGFGGKHR